MAGHPVEKPTLVADTASQLGPVVGAPLDAEPPIKPGGGADLLESPFATMSPDAFLKLEKERHAFEIRSQLGAVRNVSPDNMARALAAAPSTVTPMQLAGTPELMDAADNDKAAVELIESSPPLAAWISKSFENAALAQDELQKLADFGKGVQARERLNQGAFSRGGTDLKLTHKSMARGLQEFQESTQIREMRSRFMGFDAIDRIVKDNPGISRDDAFALFLKSKEERGELDFTGQPTREQLATFSAYFNADEAGRAALRNRMMTRLAGDKEARADFQKLILLYNAQRSDGEEFSADNFLSWMAYHTTATIPIALELVALGWLTGGTGLVAGATAMEIGGANAEAVVMADAGELNAQGLPIDTTDAAFQQRLVLGGIASGVVESVFGATTNVVASPLTKSHMFKALSSRVAARVAQLGVERGVKAATKRGAVATARTVRNAIGEGFEEVIQGVIMDWAVTNGMPDTDDPHFWDRVVEEFAAGMFAGGAISGPMQWRAMRRSTKLARLREAVGKRDVHVNEIREVVKQARADSDWILNQNKNVEEMALPKRSPEAFADFIDEHALNQSSIYIDAASAQAIPEDVRSALDISSEDIETAIKTDAAVEVNLGLYLQAVPGVDPETAELFVNNGFLKPDGIGKAQAVGLSALVGEEPPLVPVQSIDPATGMAPEAALAERRDTFVEAMVDQMNAANKQGSRNRPAAEIYGGFMNSMATSYGPEIYEDLPGVRFQGPAQRIARGAAPSAEVPPASTLKQSAVQFQETPLVVAATGPHGRILKQDVARALTDMHMAKYGRVLNPVENEDDFDSIVDDMVLEFDEQQAQSETGLGWYNSNITSAIEISARARPELLDPVNRDAFMVLVAITSQRETPFANWEKALDAWEQYYDSGGSMPTHKQNGKGFGLAAVNQNMQVFQHLINTLEGDTLEARTAAAIEWLTSTHTGRELAEIRKASGQYTPGRPLASYKVSETNLNGTYMGAALFGPKIGEFYANVSGLDPNEVTIDFWMTQGYNRHTGTQLDIAASELAKGKISAEPRTPAERATMKALVRAAAERRGIDPQDMQAALWFFEQRLERAHGINTKSQDFAGAATLAVSRRSGHADPLGQTQNQVVQPEVFFQSAAVDSAVLEHSVREDGGSAGEGATDAAAIPEGGATPAAPGNPVSGRDLQNLNDPEHLADFLARPGWAIVTATREDVPAVLKETRNNEANDRLEQQLDSSGVEYVTVHGRYKGEDQGRSYLIIADEATALALGRQYSQETILTNEGLIYSNLNQPSVPATGEVFVDAAAREQDNFSETGEGAAFSLGLDFDRGPGVAVIPEGFGVDPARPQLPITPAGNVILHHWSDQLLTTVDPAHAGTGPLKGDERRGGLKVTFWGINPRATRTTPGTGYVKEGGLGAVEHVTEVPASALYPYYEDPAGLVADAGGNHVQAAKAIQEAGYAGMYVTNDGEGLAGSMGNIAMLFEAVDVQPRVLFQSAWHGSPHVFEKFDINKLGTGEGAQAFGWGLYFAQRKKVAETYRPKGQRDFQLDGLSLDPDLGAGFFRFTEGGVATYADMFPSLDPDFEAGFFRFTEGELGGGELLSRSELLSNVDNIVSYAMDEVMTQFDDDPTIDPTATLRRELEIYKSIAEQDITLMSISNIASEGPEGGVRATGQFRMSPERKAEKIGALKVEVRIIQSLLDGDMPTVTVSDKPGRTFRVDLPADEELLIYDAVFNDQPQGVQDKLLDLLADMRNSADAVVLADMSTLNPIISDFVVQTNLAGQAFAGLNDAHTAFVDYPTPKTAKVLALTLAEHGFSPSVKEGGDLFDNVLRALDEGFGRFGNNVTGEALYNGLSRMLGSDKAASLALLDAGIPGHRFLDGVSRRGGEGTFNFVIYTDQAVKVLEFEQRSREETAPRGQISFPSKGILSGRAVIDIFETSDASTIPHELSHYFLAAFQWVAQQDHVPQTMKDDLAKMNVELGRAEGDMSPWTVEQQEQFAESFENYLLEGVAPSNTLRKAFRKLSAWLVEVYNKLSRRPGFRPTPQMTELIDRMIATETEIELAKEVAGAKLLLGDSHVGMTKETFEVHKRVAEKSDALAYGKTLAVAMKKIKRRRTEEYKARLDELREEVRAEVEAQPVYGAISLFGASTTVSLDKKQIVDLAGPEALDELSADFHGTKTNLYKTDGGDINVLASDRGYDSAGQMINAMRNAAPIDSVVEKEAKARAEKEIGDPADEDDIRAEAEASINNAAHNEVVAREIVVMSKAARTPRGPNSWQILNQAMREQAEDIIAGMRVRDIIGYRKFLTASKKAARTAERELTTVVRKADGTPTSGGILALQRAVDAKNQQLLNDHLYRIARERTRLVNSALHRYQRMSRTKTRQAIGPDFMDQIDAKLDQYDFRKKSEKQVRHEAKMSYDAFRQQMIAEGREGELAALTGTVIGDNRARHYTDLTGMELEGVMAAIDNLAAMGRATTQAQQALDMASLAERSQAVVNSIEENLSDAAEAPRESGQKTFLNKFGDNLTAAQLMVQNARTITRRMDGWKDGGLAQKYIYRPLAAAANALETRRTVVSQEIADLYKAHFTAKEMKKLTQLKWRPEVGMDLSHAGVLSLALNTGNVTNFDRLVNSSKDPFTPENLQALFDAHLTEADWRFVNDVWKYIDSFWPEISALERKVTGLAPKKVEAKLMVDAPDFVTGGYYPIAYDRSMNIQQIFKGADDIYGDANMAKVGKAQTAQGHLKAREDSTGYAIDLNLGVWDHHVMQVVHDLSMREAINDVGRLLSPHGVKTKVGGVVVVDSIAETLNNKGRSEDVAELNRWLRDTAAGEQLSARGWESYMRFARKALTVKYIGLKASTVLIQPLGLVQSGVVVGNIAMVRGTAKYLRNPLYWKSQIMKRSQMMPNRARLMNREMNQFQAEAAMGSSQLDSGLKRWENFVMMHVFVPMQQVQLWFVDMPTWVSSFEKNLAKGMTEAEAALQADDDVNRAQGSGLISDRAAIERGTLGNAATRTELVRSFTLLASYIQAKYNVYTEVKGTFSARTREDGVLSMAGANALARATGSMMQMFAVEAVLIHLLRGTAPDFEEDDMDEIMLWFLRVVGADVVSMHPATRQAGALLQGFDAQSLPQDALIDMVGKSVKSAGDIVVGEGDVRDYANVADVLLTPLQLPTGQMKQLFYGLASDDPVANTARAVVGLPQPRDD